MFTSKRQKNAIKSNKYTLVFRNNNLERNFYEEKANQIRIYIRNGIYFLSLIALYSCIIGYYFEINIKIEAWNIVIFLWLLAFGILFSFKIVFLKYFKFLLNFFNFGLLFFISLGCDLNENSTDFWWWIKLNYIIAIFSSLTWFNNFIICIIFYLVLLFSNIYWYFFHICIVHII